MKRTEESECMSRTKNSLLNIMASMGGQLLTNVLRWICRMVFIYTLGKEYLGISSLYTNILTILSLSELGLGSAITYSLYKPLAEKDTETIRSLMAFFKKAYRWIGIAVLILGLCLMPFLPYLMTGSTDVINIYLYYALYLTQTVVSYLFFAYKSILLTADQKKYISDVVMYVLQIVMNAVQIVILFVWHSFFAYTVAVIIYNIVYNMAVAFVVDRKYPYLKGEAGKLSKDQYKDVFSRVYAMSLYRICNVVGTSTDNLIISANISVIAVGLYDNYYMIIQVIQKMLAGIFQAFTSSLGNFYVLESKERNEFLFRTLNLANSWLVAFCSVCFAVLLQPFIQLCFGAEYLLDDMVVIIIVINFATNFMQNVVQIYRNASGVFVRGKYRAVIAAVMNLVVSIILVKRIGLAGVFLGSIISRIAVSWWFDAFMLYKHGFHTSPWPFFRNFLATMSLTTVSIVLIQMITVPWQQVSWIMMMIKGILCVVIPNVIYLLVYGRSEEFRYLADKVKSLLVKKYTKRKKS